MTERKIEILSPAGSYPAFEAALKAGADAVYVGGAKFGARAYADNFTEEELIQAIREAHFYGRKIYLTVNTLLKESEIDDLYGYLAPFYENGLDAVIVQDTGVLEYINTYFPGLDIHASTQMTITGSCGSEFAEAQGITRVVPARELSLKEIREIRAQTDLEIECFVHGALCYCYSGQCLLSSMIGGRSGNRGQCAQPCRLPYTFNGDKKYFLSPKDICTLEIIPDLIEAGIDSFKIEGRMKKPEYVAGVTSLYRKYTDMYLKYGRKGFHVLPEDRQMLMDLYNRGGSSSGYYKTRNGREMMSLERPNHAGVPALKVQYQKGREVHAAVLTDLNTGDVIEITDGKDNYTLGSAVKKGGTITFLVRKHIRLQKGMILNRIRNESLLKFIDDHIIGKKLQRSMTGELTLRIGSPAVLQVTSGGISCRTISHEPVQAAQNRPMDSARICAQIKKTGNSEFYFDHLDIEMDENIFLPVQQLNLLRRSAMDMLKEKILSRYERTPGTETQKLEENTGHSGSVKSESGAEAAPAARFSVYAETPVQLKAVSDWIMQTEMPPARLYAGTGILAATGGENGEEISDLFHRIKEKKVEIISALPHIFRSSEYANMEHILNESESIHADGVLIRNLEEFQFLKKRGFDKKIILDHNLYVFNRYAKRFWNKLGVSEFTAPLELNSEELACLGLSDCELEIYGRAPVMVSAQCLFKTSGRCRRDYGLSGITDRCGSIYPVKAYCDSCYNVIHNDRPLCLAGEAPEIRLMNPRYLRIRFTTEAAGETAEVLKMMESTFCSTAKADQPEEEYLQSRYTEGHFRRGIL